MVTINRFLLECPGFKENFDSLWDMLKTKAGDLNPVDEDQIVNFITNLDQHHKRFFITKSSIIFAAAVGKSYKIRTEKLHELGAPWLTD